MVSLSPGPVSVTEAWYVPDGAIGGPLFPPHDVVPAKPHSRISSNKSPGFDFAFFLRATSTQAGSQNTAPKATRPEVPGWDFRSREAF